MEYITFKKLTADIYSFRGASTRRTEILGCFLCDDVGNYPLDWITWVNGLQPFTSSNVSRLYKDDKHIYINDLYAELNDETCFETTKEIFIKVLHDWDKLIKQKPNHIYVTIHDNDNILLEGSNDLHS